MYWPGPSLRLAFLCLLLGCGLPLWVHAAPLQVLIVSAERNAAFTEAAEVFTTELERGGVARSSVQYLTLAQARSTGAKPDQVVLALGVEAATEMARTETRVPVLGAFVPSASFEAIVRNNQRRAASAFSVIYLNQPLGRQLDLIQLALPQRPRIGVLLGTVSSEHLPVLEEERRKRSMSVLQSQVDANEPMFAKLQTLLEGSQVLLALPDPQVYNSGSLQNILLSALRANVPMVSFSPAYVKAGALMAIYTTPAQVGQQAAQLIRPVLQGKDLAPPQYPREFWIEVNGSLARSMNLDLDAHTLTERLKRLEQKK
ncbi:MAG TPA: ABC transporter substrate binding protein [Rhodoferax sp.]|jgi:ABC-type uncharacterized transport system substrate-binding protein|nr:ABC transporter substrate binding protein [Rhodoferax sp.]HNV59069.1 ABC transporter substrate binding protein [Rhodoferax sp.]HPW29055.1 ABC transporter substrate binding protein [Rhodoferax sp.]